EGEVAGEERGEEGVVAVALPAPIERYQEHVLAFEMLQDRLTVSNAADRGGKRRVHAFQDRGGEQELPNFWRLDVEHFLDEIVGHQPLATVERCDERRDVFRVTQRKTAELQPPGPPSGSLVQP